MPDAVLTQGQTSQEAGQASASMQETQQQSQEQSNGTQQQTGTQSQSGQQAQNLVNTETLEIPEKFRVTKADGTVDHAATLRKTLGSIAHLEKKIGSGDIPPENESGYKLDYSAFPEDIRFSPDGEKAFLKRAHGKGITNAQAQFVINEYAEAVKQGLAIQQKQAGDTVAAVNTDLAKTWGDDNKANIQAAQRAFAKLADDTDKTEISKIGVDASVTYKLFMKFLAKVGAGLDEDSAILPGESAALKESLNDLRNSEAYLKADHPDHAKVMAKVTAMYEKLYPKK